MSKQIDYKKAGTYYLVGNLFNKGIAFLTLPIFTRILSTYDYGITTTYASWVGILSMFMGFALHMAIRCAYIDYREQFDQFTSSILWFTVLSSICFSTITIAITQVFRINVNITFVILCLLEAFANAIINDYSYYLMMQYKFRSRTVLMILPNLISTICSMILIIWVLKSDLYMGRIFPSSMITLVFSIILLIIIVFKTGIQFNTTYIRYALKISAPLIVHGVALNILSQSDRTMITWLADAGQTGIYSLIYNFSMIATVITTSLEGIWIPWFMQKMKEHNIKEINKLGIKYVELMTYVMIGLILVSPEIVKILAHKAYWVGISIIPPIVLANYVIFMYTLYVNVEHFYKKTIYITCNTVIAALANIGLNYIFIPKYGYVAAAFTTLAAYIISFTLHAIYAKKLEHNIFPIKMFMMSGICIAGSMIIFYLYQNNMIVRWLTIIAFTVYFIYKEKEYIVKLVPSLKKIPFFRRK